jgi:hypothetical protein
MINPRIHVGCYSWIANRITALENDPENEFRIK